MKISRAEPLHHYHHQGTHVGFFDRFLVKGEREEYKFYRRMFDEDFSRLFRPMNRQSGNLFEIVSNDDELTNKLLSNMTMRYAPRPVDESISELVEEIARSLLVFGRAYFLLYDDAEQEKIRVVPFSPVGVMRLFGTYVQWIPKRRQQNRKREYEELPREIRILDATKIMRFNIPRPIKQILTAQNSTLAILDKHHFGHMDFYPQVTHENPNPTNHFDFQVWEDTQNYAFYRATRRTGWNGRRYDSTKRSEFFDCHRLIRFRRNQLLLRDDILNQLSKEFSRVGKSYKADFSVEISGTDELPNVAHLNELEARLEREKVGFNEIIEYCYKR